jgi:ribosome-associated translation inhibitor RaiA
MTIQLNADNHLHIHADFGQKLTDMLTDEFARFSENISRIEVHLSDENGSKEGPDDKRCMLEARVDGRPPIAVTAHGDTYEQALSASIDKLTASLETVIGKMKSH